MFFMSYLFLSICLEFWFFSKLKLLNLFQFLVFQPYNFVYVINAMSAWLHVIRIINTFTQRILEIAHQKIIFSLAYNQHGKQSTFSYLYLQNTIRRLLGLVLTHKWEVILKNPQCLWAIRVNETCLITPFTAMHLHEFYLFFLFRVCAFLLY